MLCPNPNGIDIREMPRRFEEALGTILEIRDALWFLSRRKEIPLCHQDGTPFGEEERQVLMQQLGSDIDRNKLLSDLYEPVQTFVRALKDAMTLADLHTTGAADHHPSQSHGD